MAGQIIVQRGAGSVGGGGGTPGGSNTQVQYNDGGAFGGDAGLTFNEATDILTAVGGVDIDSDAGLLRLGASQDVVLARDAANILAQRNGTNAQQHRIYGTFTDASNYERYVGGYDTGEIAFVFKTERAGTGSASNCNLTFRSAQHIQFFPAVGGLVNMRGKWFVAPSGGFWGAEPDGSWVPGNNDTIDIGEFSSGRIRDINIGRWLRLKETTSDPGTGDLAANAAVASYSKNNKLVLAAYNNGGTMTYVTLALDGSSTTLVHSTTAP